MMTPVAYLDGRFLPLDEAHVPVLDRGFLLGDGVYEVIPVYHGRLFRLHAHLARLEYSLAETRIANPHDRDGWREILEELVRRNGGGDRSVYLQITRGVAARDHAFPPEARPTVFVMSHPLPPPDPEIARRGVSAVVVEDIRWARCDIKSISLLGNVLLRQAAIDRGAQEAILLRDGEITEGAASNVFIVEDGRLITPPKGPRLLPGITRDLVLELAERHHIPHHERPISEAALRRADEIWLTSSTKEILPVTRLDGERVGKGEPGPQWRRMHTLYQDFKARLAA